MNGKWHGGKGDSARPISNREQFEKNWDLIFGKKDNEDAISEGEGEKTPAVDEGQTS